jgi:hypothetical protein
MILTRTIECVSRANVRNECVRVLEIDEKASLYQLHKAIQIGVNSTTTLAMAGCCTAAHLS